MTSDLPYLVNADGTVAVLRRTYLVKGGQTVEVDVPLPAGPAGGWTDEKRDAFMRKLEQMSAPMIRSGIKRQFGTTKYRLIREERIDLPGDVALAHHQKSLRLDAVARKE